MTKSQDTMTKPHLCLKQAVGRLSQVFVSAVVPSHTFFTEALLQQEKILTGSHRGAQTYSSDWMTLNTRGWQVHGMKEDLVWPMSVHVILSVVPHSGRMRLLRAKEKLPGRYLCAGSPLWVIGREEKLNSMEYGLKLWDTPLSFTYFHPGKNEQHREGEQSGWNSRGEEQSPN